MMAEQTALALVRGYLDLLGEPIQMGDETIADTSVEINIEELQRIEAALVEAERVIEAELEGAQKLIEFVNEYTSNYFQKPMNVVNADTAITALKALEISMQLFIKQMQTSQDVRERQMTRLAAEVDEIKKNLGIA